MKLDTTEAVLEWARSHPTDETVTQENWDAYCDTAERLALGQRVLAIVERLANHPSESERASGDSETAHYILAEASAEKGHGKAAPLTPYGQQLLDQRTAERDAALAKAEAAEKAMEDANHWRQNSDLAYAALCNRIEALADEWEVPSPNGRYYSALLRALLQPAKAETALDLVDALIKANSLTNGGDRHLAAELFKLRKLLENERKDPT